MASVHATVCRALLQQIPPDDDQRMKVGYQSAMESDERLSNTFSCPLKGYGLKLP